MNKLVLNPKARNHLKIFPFGNIEIPASEKDQIEWCQAEYSRLETSNKATRVFILNRSHKGYMLSVWVLDNRYYLIQSLRNEFKTYNNTIYISEQENVEQDFINLAKFLAKNIETIGGDYRKQILDAKKYIVEDNKNEEIDNSNN